MRGLIAFALVLHATARGEIYTWTDSAGTVHYTDNPSSVPAKAKAKTTSGADISTVSTVRSPASAPAVEAPRLPSPRDAADSRAVEREWRAAFRDLAERQARLEDEIELDRRKVEEVDGLPVAARFHCFHPGVGAVVVPGSAVAVTPGPLGSGTQTTNVQGGSVRLQAGPGQTGRGVSVGLGGGAVWSQSRLWQTVTPGVFAQPCLFAFNPEFERARERLEVNRRALERLKAEAADLERRASFEGVPREWRR